MHLQENYLKKKKKKKNQIENQANNLIYTHNIHILLGS